VNDDEAVLGEYKLDQTNLGLYLDGESRAFTLEQRILDGSHPQQRHTLMNVPVSV
jgi:hypothetical protein